MKQKRFYMIGPGAALIMIPVPALNNKRKKVVVDAVQILNANGRVFCTETYSLMVTLKKVTVSINN